MKKKNLGILISLIIVLLFIIAGLSWKIATFPEQPTIVTEEETQEPVVIEETAKAPTVVTETDSAVIPSDEEEVIERPVTVTTSNFSFIPSDNEGFLSLILTVGDKKTVLYDKIQRNIYNPELRPELTLIEDANLVYLHNQFGDAGFIAQTHIYINYETGTTYKITEENELGSNPKLTFKFPKGTTTFSQAPTENCSEHQGESFELTRLLQNDHLTLYLPTIHTIPCQATNYEPLVYTDLVFTGIAKDFSKAYFSLEGRRNDDTLNGTDPTWTEVFAYNLTNQQVYNNEKPLNPLPPFVK